MTRLLWHPAQGPTRLWTTVRPKPTDPFFGQSVIQSSGRLARPNAATLKAYHLPVRLRFGAVEGFNLQDFRQSFLRNNLDRLLSSAAKATPAPLITTEDFLLEILRDFRKDIASYKATSPEGRLRFFPQSYIGQTLGMTSNLDFLKTFGKNGKLKLIEDITQELEANQTARFREFEDAPVLESSRKLPDENLSTIFQKANEIAENADRDKVDGDIVVQLFGKLAGDSAGSAVRRLEENGVLRYQLDVKDYLDGDLTSELSMSGDPAYGQNISEHVRVAEYHPFPLRNGDVRDALKVLRHPNRHVVLDVPSGINPNLAVETLARQASENQESATFMRIDFPSFVKTMEKSEQELTLDDVTGSLRTRLVVLTAEHGPIALHLTNLESLLAMTSPAALSKALGELSLNGKVHLIFTPDSRRLQEIAASRPGQPVFTLTNPSQLTGFINIHLDKPLVAELETFLERELTALKERYGAVRFRPEAVQQAILMATRSGDPIGETTVAYLESAAQNAVEGGHSEVTAEDIKKTVHSDPVFNYLDKAAFNEPYRLMRQDDLREALEDSLSLVGQTEARKTLDQIVRSIRYDNPLEQAGIATPRSLLVYGPSGTGKTPLLLNFARENDLPVVYLSGSKLLALRDANRIEEAIRQAFDAARKESEQRKAHGQPAHVLIIADELENCVAYKQQGAQAMPYNPLLEIVAAEAKRLEKRGERNLTIATLTSNPELAGSILKHPAYKKSFDELVETTPPSYITDRQKVLEAAAEQIERKLGYPVFDPKLDFSIPARLLGGINGKQLQEIVRRVVQDAQAETKPGERVFVSEKRFSRTITELFTGPENHILSKAIRPTDKKLTAYHEVGHAMGSAVMKRILGHTGPDVAKLTIVPQGHALGVTFYINEKNWEATKQSKSELFTGLVSSIASTPAEQLSVNEIHGGRSNDLEQATHLAQRMVAQLGMFRNRLVVENPMQDAKTRQIIEHVMAVAEQSANIIFRGYHEFIETVVTDLAGEDGNGGMQTMEGEDFLRRLDQYIADNPKVAQRVKREVLRLLVREGLLEERFHETRRFLPRPLRGIRENKSPYPELDRRRASALNDSDEKYAPKGDA